MLKFNPVSDQVKHTAAHILAAAVTRLYPDTRIGIGPVTKDGFFYDFDLNVQLNEEDIPKIESEINQIIQENLPMQQITLDKDEAINMLLQRGQIYKAELARALPDAEVSFYKTGDFVDLCRGPHVYSTGEVGPIKLQRIDESFWNEDETRPRMQRIYAMVFNNIDDLNNYYKIKQEEKERHYLTIIKQSGLGFSINHHLQLNEEGALVLKHIEDLIHRRLSEHTPEEIYLSNNRDLDEASAKIATILLRKHRSYREFPKAFKTEFFLTDYVFHDFKTAHKVIIIKNFYLESDGLNKVTQLEKITSLFKNLKVELTADIYTIDVDSVFTNAISNILQKEHISHSKIARSLGEQIKIKLKALDLFQREWDVAEVIFERNITTPNIGEGNSKLFTIEYRINPLAILGYILENTKGDLPPSIAPYQLVVVPINKSYLDFATKVDALIKYLGYSSKIDFRSMSLKRKLYIANRDKISLQVILGEKELANDSVSFRHANTDIGLVKIENLRDYLSEFFAK